MTYREAVHYLLCLGQEVGTVNLGLERVERMLDRLGRPERAFPSIHIAGTNGKGSTAAMVEAGLRAAGLRTGLYTSPHLVRVNERIRIDGREISDEEFGAAFEPVRAAVEGMLAEGTLDHPTFFECVTALAFSRFRQARVDYAVVEVGLGGRLDATNVLQPRVSVVTPIDFDHESYLGRGAAAISAEKAGILKPGAPAVFARQRPEAAGALQDRARQLGIPVVYAGWPEGSGGSGAAWDAEQVTHRDGYYCFVAAGPAGARLRVELSLAGEHQVVNALAAIATLNVLGVEAAAIETGLRQTRWPGRLERVAEQPLVLLDGAHNPGGARALARYLEQHHRGRRVWLIYSAARDKAIDEVAGVLFPLAEHVLLTPLTQPRALSAPALLDLVGHHHPRARAVSSLVEAWKLARASAAPTDIILVTGSLYLVGEFKALG